MIPGSAVHTRLACPDDLEEIGRLLPDLAVPGFSERFPRRTVADFCRWKYFSNPLGDAAVGVALNDHRVVSLVAGVPKRIFLGAETVVAFELGDFITAPSYRNRGLFSQLLGIVCEEALSRGAALAYVAPNSKSFSIFAGKLSFREVQKIDERRYIVPSGALERKMHIPGRVLRVLGSIVLLACWRYLFRAPLLALAQRRDSARKWMSSGNAPAHSTPSS